MMAHDAAGWIGSGLLQAAILGLTLFELAGFWVFARFGLVSLSKVLPTILAGDFLLLAWLVSARHAPWFVIAACLLGALVAHGVDMAGRIRR